MTGLAMGLALMGCATDQDNETPPTEKPKNDGRIDLDELAPGLRVAAVPNSHSRLAVRDVLAG